MAQLVKNLPAKQEVWEDLLEKGKATNSSILAWRIPGLYIVHGVTKSWTGLSDFCILSPRLGLWLFVNREWNSLPFPDRLGN